MIEIGDFYTKPMMNDQEIEVITNLLKSKSSPLCLEWGSGNSTLYYPYQGNAGHWISIEHNGEYAQYVIEKSNLNVATILPIPLGPTYYECMLPYKDRLDFILVDGEMREQCTQVAVKIARKDTIVLLHDAGRKDYEPWLKNYQYETLTVGEIPEGDHYYKHRGLIRFKI